MKQNTFCRGLVFSIIIVFVGTSMSPLARAVSSQQSFLTDSLNEASIQINGIDRKQESQARSDGLAPHPLLAQKTPAGGKASGDRGYFYGYCAYDPSGGHPIGPITFDDPGAIESLGQGPSFITGADIDPDGTWYGILYYGGIYSIGFDGVMELIASSIPANGLEYDPANQQWYCCDSTNLYIIDMINGQTTTVGSLGTQNTIIGLACDNNGNMYGYDVLFSGSSTLYSINTATGTATAIGSMGVGFLYAQDPGYDLAEDILYIAGYTQSGTSGLYTCDTNTGMVTLVGVFEGNMEVDGFAFPNWYIPPSHDVGVSRINAPSSGDAMIITPEVTVFNHAWNDESSIPINLRIDKELFTETIQDFEVDNGSYIHFAKMTDNWQYGTPTSGPMAAYSGSNVWATVLNGNYPNNMWTGLKTPEFVVPSGVTFSYWQWYQFESGYDGGNVKISTDGGTTFTLITPIGGYPGTLSYNPYMIGQPAFTGTGGTSWHQVSFDLSDYAGQDVIILWETASDSSINYAGWFLDDVGVTETSEVYEYNQTIYADIPAYMSVDVLFPDWTPADLGISENINVEYIVNATTQLSSDQLHSNDYKQKTFTLHYGFFHDVALTEIISPISGLAQTQTPQVVLEDHGQNDENVNVNMVIGKAVYTTLLEEDFSGGVPPAGWGTNYPQNWYSSNSNYAGGIAPEAGFSWTPSSVGEHRLYTTAINTTGYTALLLKFKEFVNDYNSNYTLKVQTSIDDGTTWTDAYVRAGGPFGPTTTVVSLSAANGVGSSALLITWDMSGDSFNINYWYIDDVWLGLIDLIQEYNETVPAFLNAGETMTMTLPDWTPTDIPFGTTIDYLVDSTVSLNTPDGYPADNVLTKVITLNYKHDVGVIDIHFPYVGFPLNDPTWFTYGGANANSIGLTSGGTFEGAIRLTPTELAAFDGWTLKSVKYTHGMLSGSGEPATDGYMKVYGPGTATAPGALLVSEPFHTDAGNFVYQYDFVNPVVIDGTQDLWFSIEVDNTPAGAYPLGVDAGPAIDGKSDWVALSGAWSELQIYGLDYSWNHEIGVEKVVSTGNWWPGTYHVQGTVKNLGVTYSESNFDVHTTITNATNVVVYDETVTVTDTLLPGQSTHVTFPDITIENVTSAEGTYKLTMQTMLVGDDHPNNDKKTLTFVIQKNDTMAPITTAALSGTMGQNNWYVSAVTVTLSAIDPPEPRYARGDASKWPTGVNHTYYKLDAADWVEYTTPFQVTADGQHTVQFYSVDKWIPPNVETPKSISFKIDRTAPTVSLEVTRISLILHNKWNFTATVNDPASGVVKVEFYVDDVYVGNATAAPWSYIYKGFGKVAQAIAYDAAGNSAMSLPVDNFNPDEYIPNEMNGQMNNQVVYNLG